MIEEKLPKLLAMLQTRPNDSFLLYAVAMEYKKRGEQAAAIDWFSRAIDVDPNYCYAYYQRGQVQEQSGEMALARQSYEAGIDAARRMNDEHARSELETALSMLS